MRSYVSEVRRDVQMERGIGHRELTGASAGALDADIFRIAARATNGSLKTAFFYAYSCKPSWEDIQMLFLSEHEKEIALETVQVFARRAKLAVTSAAKNAEHSKRK